jgi:outer membrane protein assembly factor BamD
LTHIHYSFTALFSILLIALLTSCTTEFERVRTSNDPVKILEKGHEYFEEKSYVNAQTLYELAIQYYRGKTEAEELFFKYAYTFYYLGEYISSSHYFGNFASTFYNSKYKEEAAFMSAYSHYKLSPNYKLDQSYSLKAIEAFQEFTNNYPESTRVQECNELIDEMRRKLEVKAFAEGELYYQIGQYQAAVVSLQNMLKNFPGAKEEEKAKLLLVKGSFIWAENSIVQKRKERYEQAKKFGLKYKNKIKNRSYKREIETILRKIDKILNNKV